MSHDSCNAPITYLKTAGAAGSARSAAALWRPLALRFALRGGDCTTRASRRIVAWRVGSIFMLYFAIAVSPLYGCTKGDGISSDLQTVYSTYVVPLGGLT